MGISENIHLMPTSLNIWAKGRNMTFKQEILPKIAIEEKLVSLPTIKKINISKIMANSSKQNFMELNTQLLLIKSMDSDYNKRLIYYSEWTYGSTVLSLIALTFTIFLVGLMICEFTAEIRRQMDDDDDDDDDKDLNHTRSSQIVNNFTYMAEPTSSILNSSDIKDAYFKTPIRAPLYENQEVTFIKAKNILNKENSSTNSLYVNMDKSDNLNQQPEVNQLYKESTV